VAALDESRVSAVPAPADRVGSSPMTVGAVSVSTEAPQEEQNRTLEESCAPQEEQNMGGRILPPLQARARTGYERREIVYAVRSTCTAVP
jgi:hypothetical protein